MFVRHVSAEGLDVKPKGLILQFLVIKLISSAEATGVHLVAKERSQLLSP